jgi:HEAT repeat protein
MKNVLYAVLFLSFPVAILITAVIRHEPSYQGKSASVWFEQIGKLDTNAPELNGLRHLAKTAVPVLQRALYSPNRSQKLRAAWALAHLDDDSATNAVPDLIRVLDDRDIQIYVMQALTSIGTTREDLIQILITQVEDTNIGASSYAAKLLDVVTQKRKAAKLPPIPSDEVEYASIFLKSSTPAVRLIGSQKLAGLLPGNENALRMLKLSLNDTNGWVREQTALLLKKQDQTVLR